MQFTESSLACNDFLYFWSNKIAQKFQTACAIQWKKTTLSCQVRSICLFQSLQSTSRNLESWLYHKTSCKQTDALKIHMQTKVQ